MEKLLGLLFIIAVSVSQTSARVESRHPEQVHLSLGNSIHEMVVTWLTLDDVNTTVLVEYGAQPSQLRSRAIGKTTVFVDGGPAKTVRYIHRARMLVTPGKTYCKLSTTI